MKRIIDFLYRVPESVWRAHGQLKDFGTARRLFKAHREACEGNFSGFVSTEDAQRALVDWREAETIFGWNLCSKNVLRTPANSSVTTSLQF